MKQTLDRVVMLFLLSFSMSTMVSCTDSTANQNQTAHDGSLQTGIAKPGFGFPSCHVGMSIVELEGPWQNQEENSVQAVDESVPQNRDRGRLVNPSAGIVVNLKKDKIMAVLLIYSEPGTDYANFSGKTEEGIDESSTIREVFETYGEPDSISHIVRHDSGIEEIYLDYLMKGIEFTFTDKELAIIRVVEKHSLPLEPYMREDVGDVRALRELAREVAGSKRSE